MPLYEYECSQCHKRTEKIQKFSDPELTVCPHCGGALARTITAPSFQFAGGGWYKDLYSSPAKPAGGEGGGASGGGDAAGSGSAGSGAKDAGAASGASGTPAAAPAAAAPSAPSSGSTATKASGSSS